MQYENPQNIVKDSDDQHAIPMVAVYLLGHKVGDVDDSQYPAIDGPEVRKDARKGRPG